LILELNYSINFH